MWWEVLQLGFSKNGIVPSPLLRSLLSLWTKLFAQVLSWLWWYDFNWAFQVFDMRVLKRKQNNNLESMKLLYFKDNPAFCFHSSGPRFWLPAVNSDDDGAWSIRYLHQQAEGCWWWKQIAGNELDVSSNAREGVVNRTQSWVIPQHRRLEAERIHPEQAHPHWTCYPCAAILCWQNLLRINQALVPGLFGVS